MINFLKVHFRAMALFIVLAGFLLIFALYWGQSVSVSVPDEKPSYGFEPVDCWFTPESDWPQSECYHMHVPENHAEQVSKSITFPVVVFRSASTTSIKAPVLHLGAGGPGAPMNLDSSVSIKTIWQYHDDMSINQGRDLFVIDPRGTGLSNPLLTCDTFVHNEIFRLKENLSFIEASAAVDNDYFDCIEKFKSQGINLSTYNSLSIAHDIDMLREAAGVDQWVLVGVSYAAIYAQIIATQYPQSVESMILDSATFPNLKMHNHYLENTMASYRALYNYCSLNPDCEQPIDNIEQRIWDLHQTLNEHPISLVIDHPYTYNTIDVVLNGERFIASLLIGTYGETVFSELPRIVTELESRRYNSITPYLEKLTGYLLDTSYGDVSASSHYCYEDKAYTDFSLIRAMTGKLPEGYIRDTALLSLDFPDYCQEMQIGAGNPVIAAATQTDIPALFLHGELDTITPLSDVIEQRKLFSKSRLITYELSHDVLSGAECAEVVAAQFIDDTEADILSCNI
ncbi:MAG: alpha/beta fold hydrolase [Spongiibacteraceae bacterium]|nr:alpha/beta fold hydrolase [Spongiibacteraceae bacterium]